MTEKPRTAKAAIEASAANGGVVVCMQHSYKREIDLGEEMSCRVKEVRYCGVDDLGREWTVCLDHTWETV